MHREFMQGYQAGQLSAARRGRVGSEFSFNCGFIAVIDNTYRLLRALLFLCDIIIILRIRNHVPTHIPLQVRVLTLVQTHSLTVTGTFSKIQLLARWISFFLFFFFLWPQLSDVLFSSSDHILSEIISIVRIWRDNAFLRWKLKSKWNIMKLPIEFLNNIVNYDIILCYEHISEYLGGTNDNKTFISVLVLSQISITKDISNTKH